MGICRASAINQRQNHVDAGGAQPAAPRCSHQSASHLYPPARPLSYFHLREIEYNTFTDPDAHPQCYGNPHAYTYHHAYLHLHAHRHTYWYPHRCPGTYGNIYPNRHPHACPSSRSCPIELFPADIWRLAVALTLV